MRIRNIIIIWFAAIISVSCEGTKLSPENKELIGEWQWVSSQGGIAGTTLTAQPGNRVIANYKKNGVYELTENGQQKISTTYEVKEGKSILTPESKTMISYGDGQMVTQSFYINGNTLFLTDEVFDGFGHTYTKTN